MKREKIMKVSKMLKNVMLFAFMMLAIVIMMPKSVKAADPMKIDLDIESKTISVGDEIEVKATITLPAATDSVSGNAIKWIPDAGACATVANQSIEAKAAAGSKTITITNKIKAAKAGVATVRVSGYLNGTTNLIYKDIKLTIIDFNITPATDQTIAVGGTVNITATPAVNATATATNPKIEYEWTSTDTTGANIKLTNEKTATVTVTGVKATTTPITLTVTEKTSGLKRTIKINVADISFSVNNIEVTAGEFDVTGFISVTPAGTKVPLAASSIKITSKVGTFSGTDTSNMTFTSGKSSGTAKYTVTIGDKSLTANITVYGKPGLTYTDDSLNIALPKKILTGGTDIESVNAGMLQVYSASATVGEDDPLWESSISKSYANGSKVSANDLQTIIEKDDIYSEIKKGAKDETQLTFVLLGGNAGDGEVNEDVWAKTTVKVYKITQTSENCKDVTPSTSTPKYCVGGYELTLKATGNSGYNYYKWDGDSTTYTSGEKKVKVEGAKSYKVVASQTNPTTAAASSSSAAAAAAAAAAAGKGLDSVPKTGERNTVLVMWIVLMACMCVAGVLLYLTLKGSKVPAGVESDNGKVVRIKVRKKK